MNFKLTVLFIPLFAVSASALAAAPLDSIGVENQNGKKIILHKLDPKDNYYSIGRRYNVRPNNIIQFNNNATLKIGGIVKVPTETPFDQQGAAATTATTPAAPVQQPQQVAQQPVKPATAPVTQTAPPVTTQPVQQPTEAPVQENVPGTQDYKVGSGESLYSIAKRFNTTVENIVAVNKLKSDVLTPGQVIKVKANTPVPPPPTITPDDTLTAARDSTMPVTTDSTASGHRPNRFGLYEKNEKGVATYIEDPGLDPNKKLVLHRTAPIGTVIKIVNPMTNRTTFAKVVGRFTDSQATKDVIVVLTKNVADSLGALDKRFQVNLSYGTPNE